MFEVISNVHGTFFHVDEKAPIGHSNNSLIEEPKIILAKGQKNQQETYQDVNPIYPFSHLPQEFKHKAQNTKINDYLCEDENTFKDHTLSPVSPKPSRADGNKNALSRPYLGRQGNVLPRKAHQPPTMGDGWQGANGSLEKMDEKKEKYKKFTLQRILKSEDNHIQDLNKKNINGSRSKYQMSKALFRRNQYIPLQLPEERNSFFLFTNNSNNGVESRSIPFLEGSPKTYHKAMTLIDSDNTEGVKIEKGSLGALNVHEREIEENKYNSISGPSVSDGSDKFSGNRLLNVVIDGAKENNSSNIRIIDKIIDIKHSATLSSYSGKVTLMLNSTDMEVNMSNILGKQNSSSGKFHKQTRRNAMYPKKDVSKQPKNEDIFTLVSPVHEYSMVHRPYLNVRHNRDKLFSRISIGNHQDDVDSSLPENLTKTLTKNYLKLFSNYHSGLVNPYKNKKPRSLPQYRQQEDQHKEAESLISLRNGRLSLLQTHKSPQQRHARSRNRSKRK
ncbi:hypothetical protein SK128_019443, partial [Halocaridina rubra]